MEKYKKYDANVQLIRIVACIIVIGCHIRLEPILPDGNVEYKRLFLYSLLNDGVTIFFMVSGFYMFKGKSTKDMILLTIKNIVLPSFLIMISSVILEEWVKGGEISSIFNKDWYSVGKNIVAFNAGGVPLSFHLWYIFDYLKIIVLYPVLRLVCTNDNRKVCYLLVTIAFANQIISDVTVFNQSLNIGKFDTFSTPIILCILGWLIYQRKSMLKTKRITVFSIFLIILVNCFRTALEFKLLEMQPDNKYFYYWNVSLAYLFAIAFVVLFLSLSILNDRIICVINYIGGKTFDIYLFHVMVYYKLESCGMKEKCLSLFNEQSLFGYFIFNIIYSIIVFTVTLCVVTLIQTIISVIKIIFKGGKKENVEKSC